MKKIAILLALFLSLALFACGKEPSPPVSDYDEERVSVSPDEEETETRVSVTTTVPPPSSTKEHVHQFRLISVREPTCTYEGLRRLSCSCGENREETLPALSHHFSEASCGKAAFCTLCGLKGEVKAHQMEGNTCTACSMQVTEPIFVLGHALSYDQPAASVRQALGEPTETLCEGDLVSLVYAAEPARLTVIQTDSVGLWGVFTMDPEAFFQPDGHLIHMGNFSGKPDLQSDTLYWDQGDTRIYGYRDILGDGAYYGLWMRYSECYYDYATDPRIFSDYRAQSRLSFYYVNALRARHGLAPLLWSQEAAVASEQYSKKMARDNFFDHDGLYGTRLQEMGIVWKSCGENISRGYTGALFVCDAYYNCLSHRENILSTAFTHVGMGFHLSDDGLNPVSVFGTQTFYS